MIAGRLHPELGGREHFLDVIGVNYYPHNQWFYEGRTIERSHPLYRPFRSILREVHARYQRPLFIAETGAEDTARAGWLRYLGGEARAAMPAVVPLLGLCL